MVLPGIQTGPHVWYGRDLANTPELWIRPWREEEIKAIGAATEIFQSSGRSLDSIEPSVFPLPGLQSLLDDVSRELTRGRGFILLRGLPVHSWTETERAIVFCGLGSHIGNPRSQNAAGHLLGHVANMGASGSDPNVRIYQTAERQTFHTDSSDVVGLLCINKARSGGQSLLVSASTIYNEMLDRNPGLLKLLLEPIATDRRGEVPEGMEPYMLIPVFSWYQGFLTVFYQRQYIESAQRFPNAPRLTDEHIAALDSFDALANDPDINLSMDLEPGDIQLVHNHSLMHDRTGFEDWPELERRRHLLRLWLSVPGDRPLPDIFATRFGSVEVGNRGGIITPDTKLVVPLSPAQ